MTAPLIDRMAEALRMALPILNENYRFLRDCQSDSGRIIRAYEVFEGCGNLLREYDSTKEKNNGP